MAFGRCICTHGDNGHDERQPENAARERDVNRDMAGIADHYFSYRDGSTYLGQVPVHCWRIFSKLGMRLLTVKTIHPEKLRGRAPEGDSRDTVPAEIFCIVARECQACVLVQ